MKYEITIQLNDGTTRIHKFSSNVAIVGGRITIGEYNYVVDGFEHVVINGEVAYIILKVHTYDPYWSA